MNTYETMKHNIPEGATHYIDGDFYFFAWVNLSEGKYYKEGEWVNYDFSVFPDDVVKPIPTEALEETKTYRYEEVTDSIFDLKEEFECGELFSFYGDEHYVQIETEGDFSCAHVHENLYRRIEVKEREFAIEQAAKIMYDADQSSGQINDLTLGALFDAGMLKLVNGKG